VGRLTRATTIVITTTVMQYLTLHLLQQTICTEYRDEVTRLC
jgi:hypothetical protein